MLVPTRVGSAALSSPLGGSTGALGLGSGTGSLGGPGGGATQKDVMSDLVDQLAALDSAKSPR